MPDWINRVFAKSCERMDEIPDASVHCLVTSVPYLGLRTYHGEPGMIGLEGSIDQWKAKLVAVFREGWRVLRPDALAWVNCALSGNAIKEEEE